MILWPSVLGAIGWLLYLPPALWPLWKSNLLNSRPLMLGIVVAMLVLAGNHVALSRLERAGVEYLVVAEWPGIEPTSGATRYALVFHAPTLPYQVMEDLKGVEGLDRLEGMGIIQL